MNFKEWYFGTGQAHKRPPRTSPYKNISFKPPFPSDLGKDPMAKHKKPMTINPNR